ncbi:MAG: tetratricopeptide repeat protein [Planctomycetes bacterium]|nr:tetratricopeptide repeat protein [Planctomycetota bacterium]
MPRPLRLSAALLVFLAATACLLAEEEQPAVKPEGPVEAVKPVPAVKPAKTDPPAAGGWGVATEEETPGEAAKTAPGPAQGEEPKEEKHKEDAPPVPEPKLTPLLAEAVAKEKKLRSAKNKVRHDEIVANFRKVIEAEPRNAEARYRLGLALARSGNYKDGAKALDEALLIDPENPRYLSDLGTLSMYAGDLNKALDACSRAASADPNSALYINALANVLMAGGEFPRAIASYKAAIKQEPSNPKYIHNLGRCLLAANQIKEAIPVLDEVIRLHAESAEAYNDRGIAYYRLLNREKALEDFKNAVRIDPECADAHHNLGLLLSDDRDPRYTSRFEALDHAKAACKLTNNRNPAYLIGLAEAFRANNQYDKAVESAKLALAMDPSPYNLQQFKRFEKLQRDGYLDEVKVPGPKE